MAGEDWPDWRGATAVIVGTGPSAALEPLAPYEGRARFFVIKSSWRLAPFADALYGIDRGWWLANQGARKFKGLKFCPSPTVCKVYRSVRIVSVRPRAAILVTQTGTVGCGLASGGGHSGFQAINLAIQFGARRIVLVGFDMTLKGGAHWSGHDPNVGRPDAKRVESWRAAMDACAPQFKQLGVEVINCAMGSALRAYPKMTLAEALDGGQNAP